MSESARKSIYEAIAAIRLVDPHTHINPHNPGSQTLADILGYHYYTELIHSSGMPKSLIEEDGISPRELVGRLVTGLPNIENTANYQWLISICQTFFDFQDDRITSSNWEGLYDAAEEKMSLADWPQTVLDMSNVEAVFLTNDFDDDLEGFDTNTYIPCLRTDDLVFHLGKTETRERLTACSGVEIDGSLVNLRAALRQRFEHFVPRGARACAISIPPSFQPVRVSDGRAETALNAILQHGEQADASHHVALSRRVFWTLAELCDEFGLPFDLMIGVNRRVYPEGVYQGQDLYDSRVSLIQYADLFNAFPDVTFPISVLASVTNQELVSYSWIFPNVVTNGHWWYSNTPSFIRRDATARLEAVPRSKQIAYYSDAYKLEFVWAKFDMYRQILSGILADHFVGSCGWSEERAVDLGHQILRGNVDAIFPRRDGQEDESNETLAEAEPQLVEEFSSLTSQLGLAAAPQVATQDVSVEEPDVHEEQLELAEPDVEEPTAEAGLGVPGLVAGVGGLTAAAFGLAEAEEAVDDGLQTLEETMEQVDFAAEEDEIEVEEEEDEIEVEAAGYDEEEVYEEAEYEDEEEDDSAAEHAVAETVELEEYEFESVDDSEVDEEEEEVGEEEEEYAEEEAEDEIEVEEELADEENDAYLLGETEDEYEDVEESEESELEETVELQDVAGGIESELSALVGGLDLDPLPSDDEIQAVDVDDVELRDVGADISHEVESLGTEIDPEPLDVGNLLADEVQEVADEVQASSEIRMLRGEEGFSPDEDTLQLDSDPLTGELRMDLPDDDVSDEGVSLDGAVDADDVSGSATEASDDPIGELESMIQETLWADDGQVDDVDDVDVE